MVGNEADDLELVFRGRRVAAVGRMGKRGDLGRVTSLFATGDLVGDGYGIRCRKANVAAQGIGAKGILRDKRSSLVVAAVSVLGIEPLLDGRLLLDVVGRDNLLVEFLLLVSELVARSRCGARAGPADRAAHEPCPGKRQRARRTRKSRSTRKQSAVLVTQFHIVTVFEYHCCSLIYHGVCPALSNYDSQFNKRPLMQVKACSDTETRGAKGIRNPSAPK